MKFSLVCLGLLIGLVSVQAKVTTKEAVGTVIDGAKSMTGVINKLKDEFIQPLTDRIEAEIRRVNSDIQGLSGSDRKYLTDAQIKLEMGRKSVKATRDLLVNLASQTITLSERLRTDLDAVIKGKATNQAKVEALAGKMKELLQKSNGIFDQATVKYREASHKLNDVIVDLQEFNKRVSNLASSSSSRHQATVDDMRAKVYGGSAACMIFPPSCIPVYATAAGVLESKIRDWKNALNSLLGKCRSTNNAVNTAKSSVQKNIDSLAREEGLVRQWESKVASVYDDVKSGDYVEMAVFEEELLAEGRHINQLTDLINACKAFKSRNSSVGI